MKKFIQIFCIAILTVFVAILGFYAYKISTNTLVFAFKNEENQTGKKLTIALDRPGFLSRVIPTGNILDEETLLSSLYFNNEKITEEERKNFNIQIDEGFLSIEPKNPKIDDIISISAANYNQNKRTAYNLPSDVIFKVSSIEIPLEIQQIWNFSDKNNYHFLVNSFSPITDLEWYSYSTIDGQKCDNGWIYWSPKKYKKIFPTVVSSRELEWKIQSEVYVDFDNSKSGQCIIAGIWNNILPVVQNTLGDFSLSWSVSKTVSSTNTVTNQIHFESSSPIIPNIATGSTEYINWQNALKNEIIAKLDISPFVQINPENISISPHAIDIEGDFQDSRKYNVFLNNISDIYWRQASEKIIFTPESNPFFYIDAPRNFPNFSGAFINIFSAHTPKNQYDLQICKLDVEAFSQASQIIASGSTENLDALYKILESSHTENCKKNTLTLNWSQPQKVDINTFFGGELKTWLYTIFLRDKADAALFWKKVFPVIFSVGNLDVSAIVSENVVKISWGDPNKKSPTLTLFPKIVKNISEINTGATMFQTGVVLPNSGSIIDMPVSELIKKYPTREFFVTVRDENNFWYIEFEIPENLDEKNANSKSLSNIDSRIFAPGSDIKVFEKIVPTAETAHKTFLLQIKNSGWKMLQNTFMKPNSLGVFKWDVHLDHALPDGEYSFFVSEIDNFRESKIISRKNFRIEKIKEKRSIGISLRWMNFNGNTPNWLREKTNPDEKSLYKTIFSAPIQIEATLQSDRKVDSINANFSYKIFKRKSSESEKIFLSEWTGKFDSNGKWYVLVSTDFETTNNDYEYILEAEMTDALTGEKIISSESIFAKLPDEYKTFDDSVTPNFELSRQLASSGQSISVKLLGDEFIKNAKAYQFQIEQIVGENSISILTGALSQKEFMLPIQNFSAGDYRISIFPNINFPKENFPWNLVQTHEFVIESAATIVPSDLRVFADKNNYNEWENVNLTIFSPYQTGNILLIYSDGNIIKTENIKNTKSRVTTRLQTENFKNNFSLQVIAGSSVPDSEKFYFTKNFPLWESTHFQFSDFSLFPNYKEWEKIQTQFSLQNVEKSTFSGEVMLEIRKKNPENMFFSNLFPNTQPVEISTKISPNFIYSTPFSSGSTAQPNSFFRSNTLYSARILPDSKNIFSVDIPLTFPAWEYEMALVAFDVSNHFQQIVKPFSITEDVGISHSSPDFAFPNDKVHFDIFAKNNTNQIGYADVELSFIHAKQPLTLTGNIILNVGAVESKWFDFNIPDAWRGDIKYQIKIKKWEQVLASESDSLYIDEIPTIGMGRKIIGVVTDSGAVVPSSDSLLNKNISKIQIRLARNWSVIVPSLLQELSNASTTDDLDQLRILYARLLVDTSSLPSYSDSGALQTDLDNFFKQKNYSPFPENTQKNLDELYTIFSMKKISANIPNGFVEAADAYFTENFIKQIENFPDSDTLAGIFLVDSLISAKNTDIFLSKIDVEKLSKKGIIDYASALMATGKVIPEEIQQKIIKQIDTKNTDSIIAISPTETLRAAYVLLRSNKKTESDAILKNFFLQKNSDISGILEKMWLIKTAVLHNEKSPNTSVNSVVELLPTISAKIFLNNENTLQTEEFERNKIRGNIVIKSEKKIPLYYEILEKNFLDAPSIFREKISENLKISTKIEKIYENGGLNPDGEFALRETFTGNILDKNTLYKATATIQVHNTQWKKWEDIIAKIFLPQFGELYINEKFSKDLQILKKTPNAIFLSIKGNSSDKEFTYSYYFRPKIQWSYLLPANFVYFKEAREFFANSSHQYFHIK